MATIASATFTVGSDTALSAYTPETGTSFTLEAAQFTVVAANDDVRHNLGTMHRAREETTVGADQMDVSADVKVGASASRRAGVCGRMTTANFTNQYEAYIQGTAGGTTVDVFLFKNVGGTRTQLATSNQSLASGTYATLKLEIRAGSQIVKLNGTAVITATEADSTLSGQTYAGIIMLGVGEATTRVDNFLSESVSSDQTVSGVGAIATLEALGTAALQQHVVATGLTSAEAIGATLVTQQLALSGLASAEAVGSLAIHLQIVATGVATEEQLGSATISQLTILVPTSIDSGEQHGTTALHLLVLPTGLLSGEQHGAAAVLLSLVATGVPTNEAFGVAALHLQILLMGIDSGEAHGATIVQIEGGSLTIMANSIASAEAIGTATLAQWLVGQGISSGEAFGTTQIQQLMSPSGVGSAESVSSAVFLALQVIATGLLSGEVIGTPTIVIPLVLTPAGLSSGETVGAVTVINTGAFIDGVELVWRVTNRGQTWTLSARAASWTFN